MKANKRKTTTAVVASVAAAALLLGGTFAWASISQQATNERTGIVNVGGRLHDDFDGNNKDVYVENFTDPLDGGQPIYARVRLDEYMEVGPEAGKLGADGKFEAGRNAESVVNGADINEPKTWTTHKMECDNGDTCFIHDHWSWTMNGGSTVYMPTFNKDKDSLEADINGTYAGLDATDTIHYDDYIKYTTATTGYVFDTNVENHPSTVPVYQEIADEYYDNDTDADPNDYTTMDGVTVVEDVTHTAKNTLTADPVMTMAEWKAAGSKPGNFWVYDTDGWAYWANPIMPGEATGLLLDGIEMYKNPGERCYYAINVVGQFATVGEWEYFDAPSADAKALLEAASKNVPVVTVENITGKANVRPGDTVEFEASVSVNGTPDTTATFEWSVLGDDLKEIDPSVSTTAIDADGKLTIDPNETNSTLTVVAKSATHSGAVGMSSVAVSTGVNLVQDLDTTATTYALLLENGTADVDVYGSDGNSTTLVTGANVYKMVYLRSTDKIAAGDTYNGSKIVGVYEDMDKRGIADQYSTPWGTAENDYRSYITEVSIDTPIKPISTAYWFGWMNNLKTITGLDEINTENVTTMNCMFNRCGKLTSVDGIDKWNTGKVKDMSYLFQATGIANLDTIKDWDVSKVEKMFALFRSNTTLTTLDLSNWDTSSADDMWGMFNACSALETITFGDNWDTSNVTNMGMMFFGSGLTGDLDLSEWNISKVEIISSMFRDCKNLTSIDLSNWDTSNVTVMDYVFMNCTGLETLTLDTNWNTSEVTNMNRMFSTCEKLQAIPGVENWNTSKVTNMNRMFNNCTVLTANCSGWDVANVTDYTNFATNAGSITEPTWPGTAATTTAATTTTTAATTASSAAA